MATPSETSRGGRGVATSRKVLITGVSKGLGRALALELASRGHTIIGCSRDQTKLDSLHAELLKSSSNEHFLFNADVRSNNKVREFAQAVMEKKLIPDIIVNNAGLGHRAGKMWELDVEDFDNVIDTNVKGIGNILRHFIPLMIPNQRGIIVNMSSNAGRNVYGDFAPYCTSKWAVEGLSKCIAKELLEGMAIVTLDPGVIYTDLLALSIGELASQFQSPEKWVIRAATMILDLTATNNGASLTVENPAELATA